MHDQSGTADTFSGGDAGLPASGGRAGRRAEGLASLWQGVPVLFVKLEEGGFEWSYSHSWASGTVTSSRRSGGFQDGSDAPCGTGCRHTSQR